MELSYKLSQSLSMVRKEIGNNLKTEKVDVPTNHVLVLDCSGSMSSDLPLIREQLKKKLPKIIGEHDTVSIIWFSGCGEFGTLVKGEFVSTLKDLSDINKAIDRWLKPMCFTGFVSPLEEAIGLIKYLNKKNPGVFSLFFMSDGHDNCNNIKDILTVSEKLSESYSASTFVEYGYYCNRNLMTSMAEKAGGSLIFSEDFDKYDPIFEHSMKNRSSGAPRVRVQIGHTPVSGFVYSIRGGDIVTYECVDNVVNIPEDVGSIWYMTNDSIKNCIDINFEKVVKTKKTTDELSALYAALSLYGSRMLPDVVLNILKTLGDVSFINKFTGCFGKQKYAEFCDMAKSVVKSGEGIFTDGRDVNKVPDDDAFTILDLLNIISSDDGNRILIDDPNFKYSKISRGRINSSDILTSDERQLVNELTAKMATERVASKIKSIQEEINLILSSKKEALKFVPRPSPDGYSVKSLTFNEKRPNISILIKQEGTVNIVSRTPQELLTMLPVCIETFIWRNYAIVNDGLVNVKNLPVILTNDSLNKIATRRPPSGLFTKLDGNNKYVFNLSLLPIINRKMVMNLSAKEVFEQEYALTKAQAASKVYNSYLKDMSHFRSSSGLQDKYGPAAAIWLKEQGITDNGFSPKSVQAESSDYYIGKELNISIKGYSKLPSIKELKEQISKNKVSNPGELMLEYYNECERHAKSYSTEEFTEWLDAKSDDAVTKVRDLLFKKSQQVFSIIVGQSWFKEFSSLEENSLTVNIGNKSIIGKAELKEIQIKI